VRTRLDQATHLDADLREISKDRRAVAVDETKIDERERQVRVCVDLAGIRPADLATRLGSWCSFESLTAEKMDEKVKATRGCAADLVARDGSQTRGPVARLLKELPSRGVLEKFISFHIPAGQKPCARERTRGLFDEKDAPGVIDAADNGADAGALGPFAHAT
jgi:hypothetical protein